MVSATTQTTTTDARSGYNTTPSQPPWLAAAVKHISGGGQLHLCVEGTIGSGKSTLVNNMAELLPANNKVATLQEPVPTWEKHGLLEAIYNGKLAPINFQQTALITRFVAVLASLRAETAIVISERSHHSDKSVFAHTNMIDGSMDRVAYDVSWDHLNGLTKQVELMTVMIYLRVTPEVAEARMRNRGRGSEQAIPREYLDKIFEAHETMFAEPDTDDTHKWVIDASPDEAKIVEEAMAIVDPLVAAIKLRGYGIGFKSP